VTFAPAPGRAPMPSLVRAQTLMELRLTLRRGESLLLTVVIPVLLLIGLSTTRVVRLPSGSRIDFIAPGVLALAVLSTAFTGQAIATGFERSYGVLKRLGASALPRWGLLGGKSLAVVVVIGGQVALISGVAGVLGWRPHLSGVPSALGLLVLGAAAFSGLGLLMAGTLRAEATLAGANLLYLLMLGAGGVMFALPESASILRVLPLNALVYGLRSVFVTGGTGPWWSWVVLGAWALAAITAATRWFRWE
jgi:ABC-2 type transport system permease protein